MEYAHSTLRILRKFPRNPGALLAKHKPRIGRDGHITVGMSGFCRQHIKLSRALRIPSKEITKIIINGYIKLIQ